MKKVVLNFEGEKHELTTDEAEQVGASELNDLLCGCCRPARYETMNGMACNKHIRCMTYEEQCELIEKLTTAMLKTNATIEKLRAAESDAGNAEPAF